MKRALDPHQIDLRLWAEQGTQAPGKGPERIDCSTSVLDFSRLADELSPSSLSVSVSWAAWPELRNPRHVQPDLWLHLHARGQIEMACQRCLEPTPVALELQRSIRFVQDEALAAAQDEESDEDVMAIQTPLDLMALLEDELIMALPLVPRHEVCVNELPRTAVDEGFEEAQSTEPKPLPFAALAGLKRRTP